MSKSKGLVIRDLDVICVRAVSGGRFEIIGQNRNGRRVEITTARVLPINVSCVVKACYSILNSYEEQIRAVRSRMYHGSRMITANEPVVD